MTRIVAGRAGGRRIEVPQRGTRPTTERVREALFNSLETMTDLTGFRVLDLFAGSGGLGFEALSRGAGHVTFVEADRRAAGVLRGNAASLGVTDFDIRQMSVAAALAAPPARPYDLVFADPPFALDSAELDEAWVALVEHGWLTEDALVIVERYVHSPRPRWPEGLEEFRAKTYGDAAVYWAECPAPGTAGGEGEQPPKE